MKTFHGHIGHMTVPLRHKFSMIMQLLYAKKDPVDIILMLITSLDHIGNGNERRGLSSSRQSNKIMWTMEVERMLVEEGGTAQCKPINRAYWNYLPHQG